MRRTDTRPLVIKGQAATIESYPPIVGIPSSCTARFGTPSTALPASATSVTPDATSAVLAAAASAGDTTLTLGTLASVATSRRYLLGLGNGGVSASAGTPQPFIDVELLPHGNLTTGKADLLEPLPCAAPNGAPLVGWLLTVSLSPTDTATIGPGVVEWTATVQGVVHKWSTAFRVVERDQTYTLTPTVLASSSPFCRDSRPDDDVDFTETIDAAWRRFVEPDLLGKALRPERIVHGPHFEAVHIAACEYFLALEYEEDQQKRAERKSLLASAMEKVLNASDLWITSEAEDLTNADPNALGLSGNAAGTMPIGMYPDGTPIFAANDLNVTFIDR